MECEAAPPSFHDVNRYCVPGVPCCWVATAMVCGPGERFRVWGAVCGVPPSTVNWSPLGLVCMVVPEVAEKFAVTVSGADIVTVVEALDVLATGPFQLVN